MLAAEFTAWNLPTRPCVPCRRTAMRRTSLFTRISDAVAHAAGKPVVFATCVAVVVVWATSGPFLGFSDTWQLMINTGTTVITFLMVFLIQGTQNRDNIAIQTKLDELIRAGRAENRFIGIEHLSDTELEALRKAMEKARDRKQHASPEVETRSLSCST